MLSFLIRSTTYQQSSQQGRDSLMKERRLYANKLIHDYTSAVILVCFSIPHSPGILTVLFTTDRNGVLFSSPNHRFP